METFSSLLSPLRRQRSSRNSVSIYRKAELSEENPSDMTMDMEEEVKPSQVNDLTAMLNKDPQSKRRILTYLLLVSLLLFLVAFLLGYITFRKSCKSCMEMDSECATTMSEDESDYQIYVPQEKELYWDDLHTMLKKYLDKQEIEDNIRKVSEFSHPSGSEQQVVLSRYVYQKLQSRRLNHVWTDSHYVNLPFPNRLSPNFVQLVEGNETRELLELEDEEVYCAYSAQGKATGGLVYAFYGREEDYIRLDEMNVTVKNNIVIVRIGQTSFAEQVAVAQKFGAVGVLIYPDPEDIPQSPRGVGILASTSFNGHVHLGTGDPFTPGFPSFNHTQFPPVTSSALPKILAQPISSKIAKKLMNKLSGRLAPREWRGRLPSTLYYLGPNLKSPGLRVQMGVNNDMKSTMIYNVFGSIEGLQEPDRYIIMGAQRDAWGPGAAKSGVGTAILLELAHAFSEMTMNGFKPRRSLLFASWDAGEFGSVGATEWLEGYLTMMHLKAAAYFNLDRAVLGNDRIVARSSPLLHSLIETVIKQVGDPMLSGQSLYDRVMFHGHTEWIKEVIEPLTMESTTYPFIAFAGVPAMELSFNENNQKYLFLNTKLDTFDALNKKLNLRLSEFSKTVAETIGLMAIKLSHENLLSLDFKVYSDEMLKYLIRLETFSEELQSFTLTLQWLFTARGDFIRAAEHLTNLIKMSNEKDERLNRIYNDKIMRVEFYFLSQYVSATDSPFRHILHGRGNHTLEALFQHFQLLHTQPQSFDESLFRKQLALVTWTLQGAANALIGDLWNIDNSNF